MTRLRLDRTVLATGVVAVLAAGIVLSACGGDDDIVACVAVASPVAARFGADVGATVADDAEDGSPRWFYGLPGDILFISDIDPEGGGAGTVRSLTGSASDYATDQRDADGSDFPDDGPASLSFASNEGSAAGGRAIQCAGDG